MIPWKTYLFFLLFCGPLFAQDSIYKTDGSKMQILPGSLKVDYRHKQLMYKIPRNDKQQTAAFKDLIKATSEGKRFKIFREKKKIKGYYVITEHNGLSLAAMSTKRTSSVGGFNVPYVLHEMVVFDGNKAIAHISFTENNDRKNIRKRMQAKEMITSHFVECTTLLERLSSYADVGNNLQQGDVAELLKSALYQRCN